METQKLQLECERCGKTISEILTVKEAKTITDGASSIYRHCNHCEKTTGWIEAVAEREAAEGAKQHPAGALSGGIGALSWSFRAYKN